MASRLGVALLATGVIVIAGAIGATSRGVAQDRSGAGALKLAEAAQPERNKKASTPRTVAVSLVMIGHSRGLRPFLDSVKSDEV